MSKRDFYARRVCVEMMEGRLLLTTYATADYFPIPAGSSWTYDGTYDGNSATVYRTSSKASANGSSILLSDHYDTGWNDAYMERYYSFSTSSGLKLHRQNMPGSSAGSGWLDFVPPITILKPQLSKGNVGNWNSPIKATLNIADLGTINASGTDTGSANIVQIGACRAGQYTFLEALKLVVTHNEKVTATVQGVKGELDAVITETTWLGKGVGMLQGSLSVKVTVKAEGESDSESISGSFTLSNSSLLSDFISISGGTLSVAGTAKDDVIEAKLNGKNIQVVRNGIMRSVPRSGISLISISGGKGNDTVTASNCGSIPISVSGGAGNDKVTSGAANDQLSGGAGKDTMSGGAGTDTISGGTEVDSLLGGDGNDWINGGAGNDALDGGGGLDTLVGDDGNDRLAGGAGSDILLRNSSKDVLVSDSTLKSAAGYDVELVIPAGFAAASTTAAIQAVTPWIKILGKDLPDVTNSGVLIDDLRVNLSQGAMHSKPDAPAESAIVGSRTAGTKLPFQGNIIINPTPPAGTPALKIVLQHEVGHVLGMMYNVLNSRKLISKPTPDTPVVTGANAVLAYQQALGTNSSGVPLQAPDVDGQGNRTYYGHWDIHDVALASDIMAAPANLSAPPTQLGAVTKGLLKDLGY